jgi:5'-3' exonuclease
VNRCGRLSAMATGDRLLLLDTASLYFRAFFGVPDSVKAPDGTPVNAVRGLMDFISRLVGEYDPSHLACCWDDDWRPQWRVNLIPSYKAHRVVREVPGPRPDVEEVPDPLEAQVPVILSVLAAYGIPVVGHPEMEADDVIGTLATGAGMPVDIVTGDRDLFQLVDDDASVRVLYVARGVSRHERVDNAWVRGKYGVDARQYADLATLRGDASDGRPRRCSTGSAPSTPSWRPPTTPTPTWVPARAARSRPRRTTWPSHLAWSPYAATSTSGRPTSRDRVRPRTTTRSWRWTSAGDSARPP